MESTDILSIVIPAYNEAESIERVIDEIPETLGERQVEVIVVDDGSDDNTTQRAEDSGATAYRHTVNRGYGAALKTGFEHANGDVVGFLDADYTYPPDELPGLYDLFTERDADIVVGSRLSGDTSGMPRLRYVGNSMFAWFASLLTGHEIADPASGMRILRHDVLNSLYPLSDDLDFTPEMSVKASWYDLRYFETPITYRERVGDSKLDPFGHGLRFARVILRTARDYYPMRVFGSVGTGAILFGGFLGLIVVGDWLTRGVDHHYTLMFALLSIFVGVQTALFGALADLLVRRLD